MTIIPSTRLKCGLESMRDKEKANSNIENKVSVNSKPCHPVSNPGAFDQNHAQGGFAQINCSKGLGFDMSWDVAKQHMGLIPT